jgi:hypothetical protein
VVRHQIVADIVAAYERADAGAASGLAGRDGSGAEAAG